MKDITKKYTNGEVTVVWKPDVCVHSTFCWKQLGEVFNPFIKPWIKLEGATTERIIEQVKKCPSGALTYYRNAEEANIADIQARSGVEVVPKGPLLIYGNVTVTDREGAQTHTNHVTAVCRCGLSANQPYCDGSHLQQHNRE